jgi:hypothetical protein
MSSQNLGLRHELPSARHWYLAGRLGHSDTSDVTDVYAVGGDGHLQVKLTSGDLARRSGAESRRLVCLLILPARQWTLPREELTDSEVVKAGWRGCGIDVDDHHWRDELKPLPVDIVASHYGERRSRLRLMPDCLDACDEAIRTAAGLIRARSATWVRR